MELVYFIHAEGTDLVKIGWTSDLDRRFDQLQTASPHTLHLLGVHVGPREVETIYHRDLAPYRQRGEWFFLTREVRRCFCVTLSRHSESARRYSQFIYRGVDSKESAAVIEKRRDETESFCGVIGSQPSWTDRLADVSVERLLTGMLEGCIEGEGNEVSP